MVMHSARGVFSVPALKHRGSIQHARRRHTRPRFQLFSLCADLSALYQCWTAWTFFPHVTWETGCAVGDTVVGNIQNFVFIFAWESLRRTRGIGIVAG